MKYFLKIGLVIMMGIVLSSCNNDDDDYANFHYVVNPIDSIAMADSAQIGRRIPITTYTSLKQNCQQFQMHGYDIVGNERTVTALTIEWDNIECGDDVQAIDPMFYFEPIRTGTYRFRFWAGSDIETEEDIFITKEITVYP